MHAYLCKIEINFNIYTSIHPSIYPSMHPCMHACMHACIYNYIYTYTCVYIYMCILTRVPFFVRVAGAGWQPQISPLARSLGSFGACLGGFCVATIPVVRSNLYKRRSKPQHPPIAPEEVWLACNGGLGLKGSAGQARMNPTREASRL